MQIYIFSIISIAVYLDIRYRFKVLLADYNIIMDRLEEIENSRKVDIKI